MNTVSKPLLLNRLEDISFSAVISDLDGVVYRGDEAIPCAVERFNHWADQGVPYCFITNNAEKGSAEFAEKIRGFGIDCNADQVITSGDVALAYLKERHGPGAKVYVIGSASLKARVEAEGYQLTDTSASCVLVALDRNFNYAMMKTALRCILSGAELIGTNPDVIRPISDGFEPGTGAILQSIATAARVTPRVLGKPDPALIQSALKRMGQTPENIIMLGDQLATDIACARNAGVRGVLVETGVPFDPQSPFLPDYIISSLML